MGGTPTPSCECSSSGPTHHPHPLAHPPTHAHTYCLPCTLSACSGSAVQSAGTGWSSPFTYLSPHSTPVLPVLSVQSRAQAPARAPPSMWWTAASAPPTRSSKPQTAPAPVPCMVRVGACGLGASSGVLGQQGCWTAAEEGGAALPSSPAPPSDCSCPNPTRLNPMALPTQLIPTAKPTQNTRPLPSL